MIVVGGSELANRVFIRTDTHTDTEGANRAEGSQS